MTQEHIGFIGTGLMGHGIAQVFDSVDALCDSRVADAVHVLVPPGAHFAVAKRCLERGLNVLVEKPMALSLEHVDELERIAKAQQLVLGVNHNQSASPAVVGVCDHVAASRLGRIERSMIGGIDFDDLARRLQS